MKIQLSKENLLKAVQAVQNVVSAKSTLPILSNILVEASQDKVRLTATDLDMGISVSTEAKVKEEGATTVPAKRFSDIIKELPESEITITAKKNNIVTIECEKCFFKVMGLPKEEFPKLPEFQNKEIFTMKQQTLKEMLSKTAFAMSKDETRYVLNGVLFLIRNGKTALVATDGRRLALIEKETPQAQKIERKMIIPSKTIQELLRTIKEEGEAKICFGENQVLFDMGDVSLISRLIEGEFPNYEQVIPGEAKEKIIVSRQSLLQAAKRASLLTNPDSVAIKFDILKDKIIVSKNTPDIGEAKEELDAEYKGNELSIGFNPTYIIDVLKNLDYEQVSFEINSPEKPGVIRTQDKYTYIVLPMQLA